MPKPKKGPRLGGSPAHQRLILRNLATALFEHGRITTTEAKARTLRPYAEKLITKAKKAHLGENPLHNRREVLKSITDKGVVHHLFTEIAPGYEERPGGYTRITKIGPRQGDNAPMAVIELVTEAYKPKEAAAPAKKSADKPAKSAKKSAKKTEAPAAEVTKPADDAPAEVEAPNEAGDTEVLATEATDVETAEAESTAEETAADEADADETAADEADADEAAADESETDEKA